MPRYSPSLQRTTRGAGTYVRLFTVMVALAVSGATQGVGAQPMDDRRDSKPAVERRIYAGMWTMHLRDRSRGVDANHLLGMSWGRYYAGTFINSFERRAYTAGVQGMVIRWAPGAMELGLGYRAGLVTGYDERFISLAAHTPVLPLVQPRVNMDVGRLGVELTYSGVITSAAMNVRF